MSHYPSLYRIQYYGEYFGYEAIGSFQVCCVVGANMFCAWEIHSIDCSFRLGGYGVGQTNRPIVFDAQDLFL